MVEKEVPTRSFDNINIARSIDARHQLHNIEQGTIASLKTEEFASLLDETGIEGKLLEKKDIAHRQTHFLQPWSKR